LRNTMLDGVDKHGRHVKTRLLHDFLEAGRAGDPFFIVIPKD